MHIRPLTNRQFSAKRLGLAAACAALLLAPLPCLALQYAPGITLSPTDIEWYSAPITISGDFSIAGASGYGEAGFPPIIPDYAGSGAVIVFEHHEDSAVVEHLPLTVSDRAAGDAFGYSVAISGQLLVGGAPFDEESPNSQHSGSAYVFRYNGSNWVEEQKLIGDDVVAGDNFGYSVAISGDTILVGSPKSYGSTRPGSVYVFRYVAGSWTQEDQFSSSDAALDDDFGEIIALSGDTAVVGVPNNNGNTDTGAVYIFRHSAGNWSQEDKLTVPADSAEAGAGASFAATIAVSGDSLLVGAFRGYDDNENRVGTVYAYRYDSVDSWDQVAKLAPSSVPTPNEHNYLGHFGKSLALSGDTAVIGAKGGILSNYTGVAYVFWYDGASWVEQDTVTAPGSSSSGDAYSNFGKAVAISETTVLVGTISSEIYLFRNIPDAEFIADDGAQYDGFGRTVAVSGDVVLVGAPNDDDNGSGSGSAYLFSYDGANWIDEDKLIGAADEYFGTSVALDGDTAVIGAPESGGTEDEYGPGAVYVFRYVGAAWGAGTPLTAADGAAEDYFGNSVAISGDTVVVGAPYNGWSNVDDDWVNGPGAAYVFRFNGASWVSQGKLTAADGEPGDHFGSSVSISGDTIVVGAPFENENGTDAGAAYVFQRNGTTWTPQGKLPSTGIEADDEFGCAVANSSDTIAVGAKRDGDMADDAGAVYVFGYDGANWVEETKLTASDGMLNARFGISVAISSENTIAIGAEWDEAKGSAYVFWHDGWSWIEEPKLTAPVRGTDYFGASVAISGDAVLVGAPYYGIDDEGAAFLSTVKYVNVPESSMLALNLAAIAALALVARRRASM